ncbi:MAG: hypothetical protein LUQ40_05205 [Methanomicrobiales archaeon]|nr:hypothetical protein [Methanomicrobiales archaeon]
MATGEVQDQSSDGARALADLMGEAQEELRRELQDQEDLLKADNRVFISLFLILGGLTVNAIIFRFLPNYMFYWIAASFYLIVLNPFILLIPSTGGQAKHSNRKPRGDIRSITKIIREAGIGNHKQVFGRIFWNIFFINNKPLAIGFSLIYAIDVLFAVQAGFFMAQPILGQFDAVLVIYQSLALITFYLGILILRPYKMDFFASLQNINLKIRTAVKRTWKVIIIIAGITAVIGAIIVTAMILPGFTLGQITSGHDYITREGVLPIIGIFLTQVMFLRFFQGVHSRLMLLELSRKKEHLLREHILRSPDNENTTSGTPAGVPEEYEHKRRIFTVTKMYDQSEQAFFGLFPVFMIVPDLTIIFNPGNLSILESHVGLTEPV